MTLGALLALAVLAAAGMTLPRFFAARAAQKATAGTNAAATSAAAAAAPATTTEPAGTAAAAPASAPATGASADAGASPALPAAAKPSAARMKTAAAPAPAALPATTVSEPPAPAGPSPEEIRAARDRFGDLDARAQAASGNIQHLRSQQQAQGYDMRGDILAALTRMNNDMRDADHALRANDLAAAKDYMDRANREIETLEKFLGK